MIINKITTGFVIQTFNTETKQFVSQEFKAADDVTWEDENGNSVKSPGDDDTAEPYLNFDMVQPSQPGHVFNPDTKRCIKCNCDEDDAFVGNEPCIDETDGDKAEE